MFDASATFDPTGAPTAAVISCRIEVNGVVAPDTTHSYSGFGVQAGIDPLTYTANAGDQVNECERDQFADGYDTGWICWIA